MRGLEPKRTRYAGIGSFTLFSERRRAKSGGASPPPAVDPAALAQAQTESNIKTAQTQAQLNNVNTTSPLGSTLFTQNANGGYDLNQSLASALQPLFAAQTGTAANLAPWLPSRPMDTSDLPSYQTGGQIGPITNRIDTSGIPALQYGASGGPIQSGLNFSGLTALPSSLTDFSNEVGQAQRAAYNTQAGYLDPQFAQKRSDLRQQLADEGIPVGSDAYSRAQGDLGRQSTFAYQQAQNAAVAAGNQEQATLFGENLGARQQGVNEVTGQGQFANAAQAQGFGQNLANAGLSNAAQGQAFGQAAQQAAFGNTAQQLLYNETAQNAGINNAARGQAVNERATQWAQPLEAFGQLANLGWAGQLPTFGGSPTTVYPTNLAAGQTAANTANANRFTAANTLNNQLFNGLGSLGGALGVGGNGGLGSALFGSGGIGGLFGGGFPAAGVAFGPGEAGTAALAAGLDPFAAAATGAAAWIICTELMRQGKLPKRHWIVGAPVFAAYPEIVKRGYYTWAVPTVRHMRRKPDSVYSRIVGAVFRSRAENIAASRNVRGARKLWRGAAVTAVLWPLCAALGAVVGEQDWASVYRGEEAR